MDFNDTPEEAAYRAQVRGWLEHAGEPYLEPQDFSGPGYVDACKTWQAIKADAGYVGITWPKAFGGQGLSPMHQIIFSQEESRLHVPSGLYEIGLGMCIPTVFSHGAAEITQRYVGPALRGAEIWCQLFSEPAAGSDLAGIRMSARREGGSWRLNGQKVWTSNAHLSDFGIVLARTDTSLPKHKGLSMFIVDMRAEGIEARPIRQMAGGAHFNEVFFTDVAIDDSHRLGAVNAGWSVALTTLMHERLAVGGKPARAPGVYDMIALARAIGSEEGSAIDRADVRARIAEVYLADEGIRLTRMRALSALSRGQMPGPDSSISKVVIAKMLQDISAFATDLGESAGLLTEGAIPELLAFQQAWLWSPGLRIAGGTDEILRNIIAERVLGLPGDGRTDKDIPFKDLPA